MRVGWRPTYIILLLATVHAYALPRVVSLSPSTTEMLFAIGAGQQVVGVSTACDYPEVVKQLPKVSSMGGVNIEMLYRLKPDVLVAWAGALSPNTLQFLHKHFKTARIVRLDIRHVDEIPKAFVELGEAVQQEKNAQLVAVSFQQNLNQLKQTFAEVKPKKVFYQLWSKPLMTVGGASFVDDVITVCGGENLLHGRAIEAAQVDKEAVMRFNPDIFIGSKQLGKAQWQLWQDMPRFVNKKFVEISDDWLQRPGPRLLLGAKAVCMSLRGGPKDRQSNPAF